MCCLLFLLLPSYSIYFELFKKFMSNNFLSNFLKLKSAVVFQIILPKQPSLPSVKCLKIFMFDYVLLLPGTIYKNAK